MRKFRKLNSIVASEIRKSVIPFIINLNIKSIFDKKSIIKNPTIINVIKENEIINLNYIIDTKLKDNNIEIELIYTSHDKQNKVKKNIN